MPAKNSYLLPRDVEPSHYSIILRPDLNKFTFTGSEEVAIDVKKPTSKIVLHSLGLKIKDAYVCWSRDGMRHLIYPSRVCFNRKKQTITLRFNEVIETGKAKLGLSFQGKLNDKMRGFYRTSYEAEGKKRWGAVTQFEATDARRAFPCWDEPDIKAEFSLILIAPKSMTALSNMPVFFERQNDGLKTMFFQTTPRMSTYLFAVVVADLECVEAQDKNGVQVRVWATPGKKEFGRFALEKALHTLPYFAEWFGIPYALPKLDMVAIPDFASGAMENWGLVTYRETALLIDPENSSAAARQRVSYVVDHELSHQWFGNLVTMRWWTHLWLNEGFASYMGPKATDDQFPEWNTWTEYVAGDYLAALHEDSLLNTHPIEVDVIDPVEIREVFDAISYYKGSAINRMLEHYLGEADFRKGLNLYLNRYAYGNAATDDLWQALEEASGKPVKALMASYTRQPGYPVVHVNDEDWAGQLVLSLTQQHFVSTNIKNSDGALWVIPVGVAASGIKEPLFEQMHDRHMRFTSPVLAGDWVKLNPGQSGFYRAAYSEALRQKLANAVVAGELPVVDRLGLLDDAFALAPAGYIKTSSALTLLEAYSAETDLNVWAIIAANIGAIYNLMWQETCREKLSKFAQELFRPIAASYGWERRDMDGDTGVLLRSLALRSLGKYGDISVIEEAQKRFARFINGGKLDPDIRQTVYSLVAENGGEKEIENLLSIYRATDLHEEKIRVLRAAGSCRNADVLSNFMEFSISDKVRSQDVPIALQSAAAHSPGRKLAWEFLKEKWDVFMKRYRGSGFMSRMVDITAGFNTQEQLGDVEHFFESHPVSGAERAIRQSLEIIRSNIDWLERDRSDIKAFLLNRYRGR